MTQALRDQPEASSQLPAELPESTVSEIASWLVGQPLDAVERELIRHTLESCGGDRALTASVLGISLPALRKKIRAYSVRGEALPESFEPAKEIPQAANDGAPEAQKTQTVIEEAIESAPTLPVPEPDNDPRLTLVETETVSEPVAAQPEVEIFAAPVIAPEIISTVAVAEPVDTVVETPKLIAGIATPRTQRMSYTAPVLAGALVLLLAAPIGYGLFSATEKSTAIDFDRNRLEVTSIESPRFEQRIQVPVWTQPARTEQAMPVDIAADRRAPVAAPVAPVVVTESVPVAAPETPTVMEIPAAPIVAAVPEVSAPSAATEPAPAPAQTVAVNPEPGTEMELGPLDIAADVAMDLGPVNRLADVRMELAPADIAADTRMDAGPVDILADVRMEFVDVPETTGSIPAPTFFRAPKNAPAPVARVEPSADDNKPAPRAAAPRPARPAQAEVPSPAETFPLLFPFNLFAPKNAQTGATAPSSPQPVDCCIR